MWHWDQGHLGYFQFDKIRALAAFAIQNDIKNASRASLVAATGLSFAAPETHSPWRNYSRALKLSLLVSDAGDHADATDLAKLLGTPGAITCDEYLHFLAEVSTEPSPALRDYSNSVQFRFPLLFALKYILTKVAIKAGAVAGIFEILDAYSRTGLIGNEEEAAFIQAVKVGASGAAIERTDLVRQARESLLVLSQISYLNSDGENIFLSIDPIDASDIFKSLGAIGGPYESDANKELRRRASLFGAAHFALDYPNTVVSDFVEGGFAEGSKVKRTHMVIERNAKLRVEFFKRRPTAECDLCRLLTDKSYPWTDRILDIHHLLPLSSGTRTDSEIGTVLDDLVPVCPTCHRSIHKFYNAWLKSNNQQDFVDAAQAKDVYGKIKEDFGGARHAEAN